MQESSGKATLAPVKIAIVFDCLFPLQTGGAERVYGRVGELLSDMGHSVSYITRSFDEIPTSSSYKVTGIWAGEIYNESGTRIPISAVKFSWKIFRFLVGPQNTFDVVIVSSTPVLNLIAAKVALFRSKTVLVADWLEVWELQKWKQYSGAVIGTVAYILQTFALKTGQILTVNSTFTANRALKYRKNGKFIKLGLIDLVPTKDSVDLGQKESKSILFVGRHIEDKQIELLIRAMDVPELSDKNLILEIVGTGEQTHHLQKVANQLADPRRVVFWGKVTDHKLDELMQNALVHVNPSRREGFGLVVAEAARWGTPSVVVDEPDNAAKELIIQGVNGFISPMSSPKALANSVLQAIDGGAELRQTTKEWFNNSRKEDSLESSMIELMNAVGEIQKLQ